MTGYVDRVRSLLAAAEPGPWFLDADGVSIYYVFHNGDTMDRDKLAESSGDDAAFIAEAPAAVTHLLARLDAVTEILDEWAALVPFPDAEETQQWYSLGKRHAAERIRAAITGEGE